MKLSQISETVKNLLKRIRGVQPVVIFDIGSSSIGGAVVFFGKEVPEITYSTRVQLPFQEIADKKHLLPQIEEVLSQVAEDVQKNGLQAVKGKSVVPQEIVCILSSLWSNTRTTNATFENKEKFIVTDEIMDNLLIQIHENNKGEKEEGVVTIEEIIVNSFLNGYPTQLPLGKEAQHISVSFLESTVTKELNTKIHDVVYKIFSPDIPLLLRSFTLVAFSVTRDMFEHIRDFVLVDVTGEITEIAVVRNSTLDETFSFPYGKNTIVRDIAKKTGSVPEDVLTRLKIEISKTKSDIKGEVSEEEKKWTELFGKACEELSSETSPLPPHVFLIVDTPYEKWFHSMIERVDFSQFTATRDAFNVNPLLEKQVEGMCILHKGITYDNFLVIESIFYNREYLPRT
ncbi:hypothetical protein HQ403_02700 [Candidatus Kaiserbacteria bacterium]|nr:hypothetical protein [Candidatus Kaiserbacteria bacterium]